MLSLSHSHKEVRLKPDNNVIFITFSRRGEAQPDNNVEKENLLLKINKLQTSQMNT